MEKKRKFYIKSCYSEEFDSRIYNILAIKLRGIKTKNNFKSAFQKYKNISYQF